MKAEGLDNDFAIQYLPLLLSSSTRAWQELFKSGSIRCWGNLRSIFIGHFQGMYAWPGNSWDLCNYSQRPNETLRSTSNISPRSTMSSPTSPTDNVINAFICGTTCKALIHALGCETPCMMRELLDVATQYATGE